MVTSKERITYLVIIAALVASYFLFLKTEPTEIVKTKTELVYDTTTINVEKVVFKPIQAIQDTIFVNEYIASTDSSNCLTRLENVLYDYSAERTYSDTLMNDSVAFVQIDSKVKFNKLQYQYLTYRNNRPTEINTYEIRKRQLFIGGGVYKGGVDIGMMYKTKKDWLIGVGYMPVESGIRVSAYIPLK